MSENIHALTVRVYNFHGSPMKIFKHNFFSYVDIQFIAHALLIISD